MKHLSQSPAAFDGLTNDEVDRYLAGQCTPQEKERISAYLKNAEISESWNEIFHSFESPFRGEDERASAESLLRSRIGYLPWAERPGSSTRSVADFTAMNARRRSFLSNFRPTRRLAIVGAALSLLVTFALGRSGFQNQIFNSSDSLGHSTYRTAYGQRSEIVLPDGSNVILNVGSELRIPVNYGLHNRTIHLSGEAYFNIKHGSEAPFIVNSGTSSTRVLGTRFSVRNYENDSSITVAVQEGRVSVNDSKSNLPPTVVGALQRLSLTASGISGLETAASNSFSFASGVLSLENLDLKSAAAELERWYDVEIRFQEPNLAERRITGSFSVGSITDLVAILSVTFDDIGITNSGRIITLYSR